MRRLRCLLAGHRLIRVITDVRLDVLGFLDIYGEITGSKIHCIRCGRDLTITKK